MFISLLTKTALTIALMMAVAKTVEFIVLRLRK